MKGRTVFIFLGSVLAVVFIYAIYVIRKNRIAEEEAEAFRLKARKEWAPTKPNVAPGRIGLRVTPASSNSNTDNFGVPYPDTLTQTMVTSTLLNEMADNDRHRTTVPIHPIHHEVHHTAPASSPDYGSSVCYETSSSSHNSHDTSSSSSYDSGSSYDSCSYDSGSSSFSSD